MKSRKLVITLLIFGLSFLFSEILNASPLDNWHWANPLPIYTFLPGLVCGNNTFVAGERDAIPQSGPVSSELFPDIPSGYWAEAYIVAIYNAGITTGYGNGRFGPEDYVTRGQMAAFIIRAKYRETFSYTATPYFKDVPLTHTFFKYVQKLRDDGMTVVSGTYGIDNYVTRGQMAAFIIRAKFGENFSYSTTAYFNDVPFTHGFFKYVQKMKDVGITAVTDTYNVDGIVTRAQMAAFLARAFLGMDGGTATLTVSNTNLVASALIQAGGLVSITDAVGGIGPLSSSPQTSQTSSKAPLRNIIDKVLEISGPQGQKLDGYLYGTVPVTTVPCPAGGSITTSITWEGPDYPDPSQMLNTQMNVIFNSCKEGSTTFSGSLNTKFGGPLTVPTSITMSTPSFRYIDTKTGDNLTLTNLTISINNLLYSCYPATDCGYLFNGFEITTTGIISGNSSGVPIYEETDHFTIVWAQVPGGESLSLSGRVNPSCLGGWMAVTTNSPIFITTNAECPASCDVVVTSGGSSVRVVCSSDFKVTLYYNNAFVQTYNTCEEVADLCGP